MMLNPRLYTGIREQLGKMMELMTSTSGWISAELLSARSRVSCVQILKINGFVVELTKSKWFSTEEDSSRKRLIIDGDVVPRASRLQGVGMLGKERRGEGPYGGGGLWCPKEQGDSTTMPDGTRKPVT